MRHFAILSLTRRAALVIEPTANHHLEKTSVNATGAAKSDKEHA
jgi:hypothetical protein